MSFVPIEYNSRLLLSVQVLDANVSYDPVVARTCRGRGVVDFSDWSQRQSTSEMFYTAVRRP